MKQIVSITSGLVATRLDHQIGNAAGVPAGQAVVAQPGETVRYSTPGEEGAEYIAVCLAAFTPDSAHRVATS